MKLSGAEDAIQVSLVGKALRKIGILPREPLYAVMLRNASAHVNHAILIGSSSGKEIRVLQRASPGLGPEVTCYEPNPSAYTRLFVLRTMRIINPLTSLNREGVIPDAWVSNSSNIRFQSNGHLSRFEVGSGRGAAARVSTLGLRQVLDKVPTSTRILLAMDIEGLEVELLSEIGDSINRFEEVNVALELHQRPDGGECDLLDQMEKFGFTPWLVETAMGARKRVREILSREPAMTGGGRQLFDQVTPKELSVLTRVGSLRDPNRGHPVFKLVRSVLWTTNPGRNQVLPNTQRRRETWNI